MSTTRERRIAKELADLHNDKDASGVVATPVDNTSLTHLKGTFPGPPDTPYAGGTFQIDIVIPEMYPFKSPAMKFDTKIWHPNVSSVTVRAHGVPTRDGIRQRWPGPGWLDTREETRANLPCLV